MTRSGIGSQSGREDFVGRYISARALPKLKGCANPDKNYSAHARSREATTRRKGQRRGYGELPRQSRH